MVKRSDLTSADIVVDFREEIIYDYNQECVCYPRVFACVEFELISTDGLTQIVDEERKNVVGRGCGYYTFYFRLNTGNEYKTDTCIVCVVNDDGAEDDADTYCIGLTEEEQKNAYQWIDTQCRQKLGKSCDDLLREAYEECIGECKE